MPDAQQIEEDIQKKKKSTIP